jgi:23S rRNA A2030 N6-methylase RlmJ
MCSKPADDGFGMHGSGLFVINPPWTLPATLKKVMPYLVTVLGQDDGRHLHPRSPNALRAQPSSVE